MPRHLGGRLRHVPNSGLSAELLAVAIAEEQTIVDGLRRLLPAERVLWRDYDLMLYEYDGSIDKHRPLAVVFPLSTEEVSQVVKAGNRGGVPYTARNPDKMFPTAGWCLELFARRGRAVGW